MTGIITRSDYKWMSKKYKDEVTDEDFKDEVEAKDLENERTPHQMDTLEEIESHRTKRGPYDARDKRIHPEWGSFPKPDKRRY